MRNDDFGLMRLLAMDLDLAAAKRPSGELEAVARFGVADAPSDSAHAQPELEVLGTRTDNDKAFAGIDVDSAFGAASSALAIVGTSGASVAVVDGNAA